MVFHILAKSKKRNSIYPLIFHDIMRLIIMQVSTHFLFYLSHHNIPLFSQYLFETLMFMVASLCVYWFCFYTIFPVEWDIEQDEIPRQKLSYDQKENIEEDTVDKVSDTRSDDTPSVITLSQA